MLQPPAEDADALIRGLIAHWREPGEAEVRLILNRIARAPFTTRWVRLPHELRQSEYLGYRFGLRAPSPLAHLAKRVLVDRQWRRGTTVEQYVEDLQAVAHGPAGQLALFSARGSNFAGVLGENTISADHLGPGSLPLISVLYDADRGTITAGYQVSSIAAIGQLAGARWRTWPEPGLTF